MIKEQLHALCIAFIDRRIHTCQSAIREAQTAANEETKSSAGDKYETGRAMAQLEIEKNSAQLAEAQRQKSAVAAINAALPSAIVQPGSLVMTNHGNFYIAAACGELLIDGQRYFAVSTASPVAGALAGRVAGEEVQFNNKTWVIHQIR